MTFSELASRVAEKCTTREEVETTLILMHRVKPQAAKVLATNAWKKVETERQEISTKLFTLLKKVRKKDVKHARHLQ